MSFPISAALLDAIVLSVVAQEPEGVVGKLKSKIKKRVVGKYQTIHYIYNIKK